MPAKTVREIVKEYLTANGYDGLYGNACGCGLDEIMPGDCAKIVPDCRPGVRVGCGPDECDAATHWDEEADFHIGPKDGDDA